MEMNSTGREELKGMCWLSCEKYTGLARRCLFGEQLRAWRGCTLCPFLQERYRQDCNLAVQLLKCNKSHFRNHKFADVSSSPAEAGKEGSWFPPAPCLFPAFSAGLLASHPSAPGRGVGGSCSRSHWEGSAEPLPAPLSPRLHFTGAVIKSTITLNSIACRVPAGSWREDRPLSYPAPSSCLSHLSTCKGHAGRSVV